MKSVIRRLSILSLLALLMVSVLSCKAAPPTATPMPTPVAPADVETFTNEEAKLSIEYPEGWIVERTILENLNTMIFRETVEEDAPELTVFSGATEGQSPDQLLDETLSLVQMLGGGAKEDWQVGEAEPVTLDEWQGRQFFAEYARATSGVKHKVYLLGIVGDGLNYAFVADALFDEWDQNWYIFEAMLDSLQFLKP
jgi:hypothetical protein